MRFAAQIVSTALRIPDSGQTSRHFWKVPRNAHSRESGAAGLSPSDRHGTGRWPRRAYMPIRFTDGDVIALASSDSASGSQNVISIARSISAALESAMCASCTLPVRR
jgi:hypothetical protein